MAWERPSDRVCELFREAMDRWLESDQDAAAIAEFDDALARDPLLSADPLLLATVQRANRANFAHYARSILADPGGPVPPNASPDAVAAVRELVRRGNDDAILDAWNVAQTIALRMSTRLAFSLTNDPGELQELLDYAAYSIMEFSRATAAATGALVRSEREQLTQGTHALRLETVGLILDGAPITRERVVTRLGYDLDGPHLAAIAWTDHSEPDGAELDATAEALATAGGVRPLSILATAGSRWIWLPTATAPSAAVISSVLTAQPAVRLALGPLDTGVKGFRRSHHDALATQRLLMHSPTGARFASWDDVRVAALVNTDDPRVREFVRRALGAFADADADLRETVRVYLREQSSAPRTARLLHTHRNTILSRIARAQPLLPRPLAESSLDVAVALEISRWMATPAAGEAT